MDKVCKALVFGGLVEVTAFDTTELVRKCATIHNTSPVATVALGKVLSIASFMSNSLKNKGESDGRFYSGQIYFDRAGVNRVFFGKEYGEAAFYSAVQVVEQNVVGRKQRALCAALDSHIRNRHTVVGRKRRNSVPRKFESHIIRAVDA